MKTISIDDLLTVKYKENGRTKEEGFDCYGFAIEVCKRFGHTIPDLEEAKRSDRDFMACMKKGLEIAKVKEIDYPTEPSDVIFFVNFQGATEHMGVYLGNDLFIHCNKHGVNVLNLKRQKQFIGRCYKWL